MKMIDCIRMVIVYILMVID